MKFKQNFIRFVIDYPETIEVHVVYVIRVTGRVFVKKKIVFMLAQTPARQYIKFIQKYISKRFREQLLTIKISNVNSRLFYNV